jgi:hypothetical protein
MIGMMIEKKKGVSISDLKHAKTGCTRPSMNQNQSIRFPRSPMCRFSTCRHRDLDDQFSKKLNHPQPTTACSHNKHGL